MTEEQNKLADRLEAMLDQVGHPDYSLKEFYDGLKLIVWELRQEREPATDAVLEEAAKVCVNLTFATEIEEWRGMTKKDVSARACLACAAAIRALKGKGASQGDEE